MNSKNLVPMNTLSKKRKIISIREDISVESLDSEAKGSSVCRARKLRAVARIAGGERVGTVAADFDVSISSIYCWIKCLNSQGLNAFKEIHQKGRPRHLHCRRDISPEQLEELAKTADIASQKRLYVISRILRGERPSIIARSMGISSSIISAWIIRFNNGGIKNLIERKRREPMKALAMRQDVPLSEMRRAAQKAKLLGQECTSRRLNAVMLGLEGGKLSDAARQLEISISSVSKWCKIFNLRGIQGLISKNDVKKIRDRM